MRTDLNDDQVLPAAGYDSIIEQGPVVILVEAAGKLLSAGNLVIFSGYTCRIVGLAHYLDWMFASERGLCFSDTYV